MFKGCRVPSEAVFGRATIKTGAVILYARLAASVLGKGGIHRDKFVLMMLFVTVHTIA